MERLTKRQKDVFDLIVSNKKISLGEIAKSIGNISRQAIWFRLISIQKKGYVIKEGGKYTPTPSGLEQLMRDGGEVKFSRYDRKTTFQPAI